jgi:hypothetical protein
MNFYLVLPDFRLVYCQVDLFDNEDEEPAVDTFGKRIPDVLMPIL